jgi:hypothetical protein
MDWNLLKQFEVLMVLMVNVVVEQNEVYHHLLIEIIEQMNQLI